jgi:predicted Zn-ribbon and HTH transcriptional regulator
MNILALLLIVAVAGMSVAHVILFVKRLRRRKKAEVVFRIQCPSCRRKLRYRKRQIGRAGMCPRCKEKLEFPAPAQPETARR